MVREGSEKPGEEAEEDGTAGRVGESHHQPERKHQVHHHPEVRTTLESPYVYILT